MLTIRTQGRFWTRPFIVALTSSVATATTAALLLAAASFPFRFWPDTGVGRHVWV